MNNQTVITRPALSDHYTVTTSSMVAGNEGWAYTGTLHRNGVQVATFEERGDGGQMTCVFANRKEEQAFREHSIATAPASRPLDQFYEHDLPIEWLVRRDVVEKALTGETMDVDALVELAHLLDGLDDGHGLTDSDETVARCRSITSFDQLEDEVHDLIERYHDETVTREKAIVVLEKTLLTVALDTIGGHDAATAVLDLALTLNHAAIVKTLLDAGANPDGFEFDGYGPNSGACPLDSAIHELWGKGSAFIIILLLMAGATPDRRRSGWTLLHALARGGELLGADPDRAQCFHWMVAAGWLVDARNGEGATPLIEAALLGNHYAVAELIKLGADVHAVDAYGYSALDLALHGMQQGQGGAFFADYRASFDALVAAGAKPCKPRLDDYDDERERLNGEYGQIVQCITAGGDRDGLARLIEGHLESRVDEEGATPLIVAAKRGNLDAMQFLMGLGANLHAVDHNGLNALDHAVGAARHGRKDLLIQGAMATGTRHA